MQVLPIAYDVRRREWYDTTASAVRHFRDLPDEALDWRDRPLTFNSACHGCHVSQLTLNYDLKRDAYRTLWHEPGINCETCHGPAEEHVRVCRAAAGGPAPADLKIVSTRSFNPGQMEALCAPCHAKMSPITAGGQPGEPFFDHYDLTAFEDRDFYPDGRDLGENYTYTHWLANPCRASGKLECMHCHTSSGRYRFTEAEANQACLPCHQERVAGATAHTHHPEGSPGNRCVSCHMPKTEFARMWRTDHSMRPPTPAATMAFKSPNACNVCHTNETAAWSDSWVRRWHADDYQAPVLQRAGWIQAARQGRWDKLPEILEYLGEPQREEVLAVSLARLLANCPSNSVVPALARSLKDPSPWVRASAANTLGARWEPSLLEPLLAATRDSSRLVRVRAAAALAAAPLDRIPESARAGFNAAVAELEASMLSRPDDSMSHYNLGNFYHGRNDLAAANAEFATAVRLQPENVPALVNGSLVLNQLNSNALAESYLRRAQTVAPTNGAVNLNLGLLLGELGRHQEAAECLRRALQAEPRSAVAAYNLGVLVVEERPAEALDLFRQARLARPDDPKYAYTLAFYLSRQGQTAQAVEVLRQEVERRAAHPGVYGLLGELFEGQGQRAWAADVYRLGAEQESFPPEARQEFRARAQALTP